MATPIPENRVQLSLGDVARITGGALVGDESLVVTGVTTDSRAIKGGELFVALVGERFDGHEHAAAALDAGARAALVMGPIPGAPALPQVRVSDTLEALGALASAHRERWGGRVVGITGSAGKTGTKEAVAAALRGAGHDVLATRGNLNNRIGVPMTLLSLERETVAVIEMGTSLPGEIEKLASIARPDVGVITLIDVSHTEGLGGLRGVAAEKGALFRALAEDGVAIGSLDEPEVKALLDASRGRVLSFGRSEEATLHILGATSDARGTRLTCALHREPLRQELEVRLPLLGAPAVSQAAIALLVVEAIGGDRAEAVEALSRVAPAEGRLVPRETSGGILVIDDSYNANPRSMRAALEVARELAASRGGRALAVLGEMRELGDVSDAAHQEVASAEGVALFAVGDSFARALEERGEGHRLFRTAEEAGRAARAEARPGDVVVVKGSRALAMERALPALLHEETVRE